MKRWVANVFFSKDGSFSRRNFIIKSESQEESDIKSLILEKLEIDDKKWKFEGDKFELMDKERIIKYECFFNRLD